MAIVDIYVRFLGCIFLCVNFLMLSALAWMAKPLKGPLVWLLNVIIKVGVPGTGHQTRAYSTTVAHGCQND